jgi:hypothetical protein
LSTHERTKVALQAAFVRRGLAAFGCKRRFQSHADIPFLFEMSGVNVARWTYRFAGLKIQ